MPTASKVRRPAVIGNPRGYSASVPPQWRERVAGTVGRDDVWVSVDDLHRHRLAASQVNGPSSGGEGSSDEADSNAARSCGAYARAEEVYDHIAAGHEKATDRFAGPWPIEELRAFRESRAGLSRALRAPVRAADDRRGSSELMVIVVARAHGMRNSEWFAHERLAQENGSMRSGGGRRDSRAPGPRCSNGMTKRLVYELITELNQTRTSRILKHLTYRSRAGGVRRGAFGELITGAGTTRTIAMQLNAFEIAIPADARRYPYERERPVRRVVAGHDAGRRAKALIDGPIANVMAVPLGPRFRQVWSTTRAGRHRGR